MISFSLHVFERCGSGFELRFEHFLINDTCPVGSRIKHPNEKQYLEGIESGQEE